MADMSMGCRVRNAGSGCEGTVECYDGEAGMYVVNTDEGLQQYWPEEDVEPSEEGDTVYFQSRDEACRRHLSYNGVVAAANSLSASGYEVLDVAWRDGESEIDLVAKKDGTYVMCDVMTRMDTGRGFPSECLTESKRNRLCRSALAWASAKGVDGVAVRFDVISILVGQDGTALFRHHQGAF